MTRYFNFVVALLVIFAGMANYSACFANPFDEKKPLNLSDRSSGDTGGTATANALKGPVADDAKPVMLAVMADLHARPESVSMIQRAVDRVNSIKDIFALAIVGDLCSKLGTRAEYDVLARGLKGLSVPAYAVPGNHDILYKDNLVNGEKKRGTPAEKKFKHGLFKKTLNLKSLYYSRKVGGHLLVFLPNDALSAIPCSMPSDDAFDFLRQTLKENPNLPTIIFCHAPLTGSYGDKKTMPPLQANAQPARKIHRLLRQNPQVYLWFAGHLHVTPSQKYYNFPGNKVGGVTVIHVPPTQIHASWIQTVRLSSQGAIVRTMDVKTGKFLKKHTRVFKPAFKKGSDAGSKDTDKARDNDNDKTLKKAKIVVVNAHAGGNRNRDGFGNWLADQEPDLALVSESVGMAPHLRPAGRFFNAGLETKGRREVSIVVRDGLAVPMHDQGKISPDLNVGIAHDRWWKRAQTRVAGVKTRVYSLHLNAVIQQPSGEPRAVNRWAVTRQGLVDLEKRWREDIKAGWAVIIGGDLNWNDSRTNARSDSMAPGRIFQRLGLAYVNNELMWLAWTPATHSSVKRHATPPTNIPGLFAGEHPALQIVLQACKQPEKDGPDKNKPDNKDPDKDKPDQDESDLEEAGLDIAEEEAADADDEVSIDDSELEAGDDSDDELLEGSDSSNTSSDDESADESAEDSESGSDQEADIPLDISAPDSEGASSDQTADEENVSSDDSDPSIDSTEVENEDESTVDSGDENSEAAAIERIRELVAELYDYLLGLLSNFTGLLRQ